MGVQPSGLPHVSEYQKFSGPGETYRYRFIVTGNRSLPFTFCLGLKDSSFQRFANRREVNRARITARKSGRRQGCTES